MLVRATRDMLLQPREGCVIGPTLEAPNGFLHQTSQMILDPVLSNTKAVLATDRSRGYSKLKLFCTPTAVAVPQYVPAENRYGAATTVINMRSDPLVIRQGDISAEARLCGDTKALHNASHEEQAFKTCALALEARLPGKVGDSSRANQVATGKLHEHLAGIPISLRPW